MSAPKLTEGEKNELRMVRDGFGNALGKLALESYARDGLIAPAHCAACDGPCRLSHGYDSYDLTPAGRAALRGES